MKHHIPRLIPVAAALLAALVATAPLAIRAEEAFLNKTPVAAGAIDINNDKLLICDVSLAPDQWLKNITPATLMQAMGVRPGVDIQPFSARLSSFVALPPSVGVLTSDAQGNLTWGTMIVVPAAGNLSGTTLASNVVNSSLTSVGILTGLTVTAPITGSVTGSAATLTTPRTINGTAFNGSANISVSSTASQISDSTAAGRALLTATTPEAALTALNVVVDQAGTAYTLSDADSGTTIRFTSGSAVTVTVPSTLAAKFTCRIIQWGAGQVTMSAGGGTTIGSPDNQLKTAKQYAQITLDRVASATYVLGGYTAL